MQPKPSFPVLASAGEPIEAIHLLGGEGSVLIAAAAEGDGEKLATYTMTVYTGAPMYVGYHGLVVIDLAGLKIPNTGLPAFRDHDMGQIVGHGHARIEDGKVMAAGVISGTGPAAMEVVANAKNDFPWQASIGVSNERMEFVEAGASVEVNGKTVKGPVSVLRASTMYEHSFVPLGADRKTKSRVAASATGLEKERTMDFTKWLKAKYSLDASALSDADRVKYQAEFDAEQLKASLSPPPPAPPPPAADPGPPPPPDTKAVVADALKAERERVSAINAACVGDWGAQATAVEKIRVEALSSDADIATVNAKLMPVLHASRPHVGTQVSVGNTGLNRDMLCAALCLRGKVEAKRVAEHYGQEQVKAAADFRYGSLQNFLRLIARTEGRTLPEFTGEGNAFFKAAFATMEVATIFEDAMNKTLLAAYETTPSFYQDLCRIASVTDFKTYNSYRLTGTGDFTKVGPDGQLKTGSLAEQKFTRSADTYGQIFPVDRKVMINDDLGALMDIPRLVGEEGRMAIDDEFFTLLLANTGSFFGSGNSNLTTGAGGAFDQQALGEQLALFKKQKRPALKSGEKAKGIVIRDMKIVVPVEVENAAEILLGSPLLLADGVASSASLTGRTNPHYGKYTLIVPPQISDDAYTGYSTTAWYLWAGNISPFVVSFLNGKEVPTIETGNYTEGQLGMWVRGYHDFGVDQEDPRGARKANGA